MRVIKTDVIKKAVKDLFIDANTNLGDDVLNSFQEGLKREESETGKAVLKALIENARIAKEEHVPICQDTGFAVVLVDIGQDVRIEGGLISDAINEGVRAGYKEGYLRKSICDPFTRKNTNDNTPAVIIYDVVEGDKLRITAAPKGGGSTNMSRVTMLKPSEGVDGIKKYIIKRVSEAGPNPCPPILIGVGIGGTMEKVALLAKKALLREVGTKNTDPYLACLEEELLKEINNLGMGPQGLGGRFYAMGIHIEKFSSHIASLPLAVNICCHACRHKEIIL